MGKKFAGSALHKGGKTGRGKRRHTRHLMRRYWILCIAMFLLLVLTAGECREYRRRRFSSSARLGLAMEKNGRAW